MSFKCKYCKKDFAKETTLVSHMCEQKRRNLAKDDKENRIAYQLWLQYRRLSMANVKHDKPYEDFAENRYYSGFVKLAKRIIDLNIKSPEDFLKFIVMNSVKMHNWTKDFVYEEYIKSMLKTESADRAAERSILRMKEWAEITGNDWREYFALVPTTVAMNDIKMGRISPWCTFATDQGSRLIDRMDETQVVYLVDYLEPKAWKVRVMRQAQDASWMQDLFNKAEIK
jgi:hypothetical protein